MRVEPPNKGHYEVSHYMYVHSMIFEGTRFDLCKL